MASFSLFTVLLILLFAAGTNASRLYPTSQESSKETNLLVQPRLLQGLTDTSENGYIHVYGADHQMQGEYYGVSVTMDVYDFLLTNDQYTVSSVKIFSDEGDAIQIGWEVHPQLYGGDSSAHLSAFWFVKTMETGGFQYACFNTNCSTGFQPEAGAPIALGDVIEPVSKPHGAKQNITIKVNKDSASGDWLVYYGFNQADPMLIGRYPKSLFTGGLADRATHITIGGYVVAGNTGLVPMGSGYLPTNDNRSMADAASFSNIQVIDQNAKASLLTHDFRGYTTLYSVSPMINGQFFYGGPYRTTM
uniref:Uncharacterized protein n=1 Tax=Avena sativa TaxID=4498 RepID=A0ACD5ZXH8_AVESA